jgi:hypothetical protein
MTAVCNSKPVFVSCTEIANVANSSHYVFIYSRNKWTRNALRWNAKPNHYLYLFISAFQIKIIKEKQSDYLNVLGKKIEAVIPLNSPE